MFVNGNADERQMWSRTGMFGYSGSGGGGGRLVFGVQRLLGCLFGRFLFYFQMKVGRQFGLKAFFARMSTSV